MTRYMKHTFEFNGFLISFEAKLLASHIGEEWYEWMYNNKAIKGLSGVYYYRTLSNNKCIYIGKAKNLRARVNHHVKEMLPKYATEKKKKDDIKWIEAFSPYSKEEVELYFIELEDEPDRRWLEGKLHLEYLTVFKEKIQEYEVKNFKRNLLPND